MKIIDIESFDDDLVEIADEKLSNAFKCVFYDPPITLSSDQRIDEVSKLMEEHEDEAELLVVHDLALTPQVISDLIHEQPKRICAIVFSQFKMDLTVINLRYRGDDSIEQRHMQKFFKKFSGNWYDEKDNTLDDMINTLRLAYDKGLL